MWMISIMNKILYLTYDGLTDPLGQSQVLPYLIELSKNNEIHIISCEKKVRHHFLSNSKKIYFFSSASVYGEDVPYPGSITENTPVEPKTYYGIAKYSAERILEIVCIDNQIELIILRPPLVYGKDDLSQGYGPTGFTYKAVNSEEIILWGDGSEFREFVYVGDVGKIVSRLVNSNYNGILNIVSGTSHTYKEILDDLKKSMGLNIKLKSCARTKEKVDHHYSNDLIHDALGNFEFTNLKDGLAQTHCAIINTLKGINEDRQRS